MDEQLKHAGTKDDPIPVDAEVAQHHHYTSYTIVCPRCNRKEATTRPGPYQTGCGCGVWLDVK